jgi:hypothetical protein
VLVALTITPEWAWAIFHVGKDVENRGWPWPAKRLPLPKRVLIHTSQQARPDDYLFCEGCVFQVTGRHLPPIDELVCGSIIGAVTITACVTRSESLWFGGRYGFVLEEHKLLPRPIACKGQLGPWTVSSDVESAIRAMAKEYAA